jgi:hypothetical protein
MFSKRDILDIDELSFSDKAFLIEKYFPEHLPEWKTDLKKQWLEKKRLQYWASYLGKENFGTFGEPFRHSCKKLLMLASLSAHNNWRGNRVTDFTKWIMSLYLGTPQRRSLVTGKLIERSVAKLATPSQNNGWELVYKDPLNEKPHPLKISSLTVDGEALWGAPDLVYKNTSNSNLIIVERKASTREVPVDGWPNLKAQLWAYSRIDEFLQFSTIHLIGETWAEESGELVKRAIQHWSWKDEQLDSDSRCLFEAYGGKVRDS